jgi:hypothetical protein
MVAEMKKSIVLEPGEEVLFETRVYQRKNLFSRMPGLLWLTQERFFLLEHRLFGPDRILEIHRSCMRDTGRKRSGLARVVYSAEGIQREIMLGTAFPALFPEGTQQLVEMLIKFQSGSL